MGRGCGLAAGGAQAEGLTARAWIIITVSTHMNAHTHKTIYILLERSQHICSNTECSFHHQIPEAERKLMNIIYASHHIITRNAIYKWPLAKYLFCYNTVHQLNLQKLIFLATWRQQKQAVNTTPTYHHLWNWAAYLFKSDIHASFSSVLVSTNSVKYLDL